LRLDVDQAATNATSASLSDLTALFNQNVYTPIETSIDQVVHACRGV